MADQLIRLIIDPDPAIDQLSVALGISEERFNAIDDDVKEIFSQSRTSSQCMKQITEKYTHDAELAVALYLLGMAKQRSSCIACMLGRLGRL